MVQLNEGRRVRTKRLLGQVAHHLEQVPHWLIHWQHWRANHLLEAVDFRPHLFLKRCEVDSRARIFELVKDAIATDTLLKETFYCTKSLLHVVATLFPVLDCHDLEFELFAGLQANVEFGLQIFNPNFVVPPQGQQPFNCKEVLAEQIHVSRFLQCPLCPFNWKSRLGARQKARYLIKQLALQVPYVELFCLSAQMAFAEHFDNDGLRFVDEFLVLLDRLPVHLELVVECVGWFS